MWVRLLLLHEREGHVSAHGFGDSRPGAVETLAESVIVVEDRVSATGQNRLRGFVEILFGHVLVHAQRETRRVYGDATGCL